MKSEDVVKFHAALVMLLQSPAAKELGIGYLSEHHAQTTQVTFEGKPGYTLQWGKF